MNIEENLNNDLVAKKINLVTKNLYRVELFINEKTLLDETNNNSPTLYLFILVLSPNLIRFHYSFNEAFNLNINPHLEFNNFHFENTSIITEVNNKVFELKTKELVISIVKHPLAVVVSNSTGEIISEDEPGLGFWFSRMEDFFNNKETNLSALLHRGKARCYKRYSIDNPPIIYGLGDKTGEINRWGRKFRNKPIDVLGYDSSKADPLYKDIPFFIHMDKKTKIAHGIFLDSFYRKVFNFKENCKQGECYYFRTKGAELNYYLFYGPKIKDVVHNYLKLTGMPALMPAFTFGYLASGMSYTENISLSQETKTNQGEELISTLERFYKKNIPVKGFLLSSGYTLDDGNKRFQFVWSENKFPNPRDFLEKLKQLGVEVCANLKPMLNCEHPFYMEVKNKNLLIKNSTGDVLVSDFWGGKVSFINLRNLEACKWWKEQIKKYLLNYGVRGIWNDNNEFQFTEKNEFRGSTAELPLIMTKLAFEAVMESINNDDLKIKPRPWIITRSGYSGIQKYAQTWTGDNLTSFETLKYEIPMISSMGLSGLVHSGADIGGFAGESPNHELLVRWVQQGIFTPRFSIHSFKIPPTEPDMYETSHPESFNIIKKFIGLRNELFPYIYNANYLAAVEGKPIQRPTVYDFQDDSKTYSQSFEYMFGDSLLIAPIYQSNSQFREIYLPTISNGSTNSWINFFNYKEHTGGNIIKEEVTENEIPVFVKANSVIPMKDSKDILKLNVFLHKNFYLENQSIDYMLYEDDGNSLSYTEGEYLIRHFKFRGEIIDQKPHFKIFLEEKGNFTSIYSEIKVNVIHNKHVTHMEINKIA